MDEPLEKRRGLLVSRLRAGERAAADELVDTYYERIYLFMRRLGHSCPVSEDLTQETFFRAWQHIGQLREGKALNNWLYRVACNVSRRHWRSRRSGSVSGNVGPDVPDGGEADYDKIRHLEQLNRLQDVVGRLPGKLKEAIILHYMQHLTIAEAAEAAGVREGTFKSRLNRALKVLRKQVT